MKKTTISDVAREAKVSIATVSYVLNNRQDQKILPETRKRVLQIANLLNYRPSHAAKSLVTGKNNVIGIAYVLEPRATGRNAEILNFVHQIINRMNRHGLDVIFLPVNPESENVKIIQNIDAIIAIDLREDDFRKLADNYLVPIIAVDMIIGDTLFYQIYTDYEKLVKKAIKKTGAEKKDVCLVIDDYKNEKYEAYVEKTVRKANLLHFCDLTPGYFESDSFKKDSEHRYYVIAGSLAASLLIPFFTAHVDPSHLLVITPEKENARIPADSALIFNDTTKKANLTVNICLNAIDRHFDTEHNLPVC